MNSTRPLVKPNAVLQQRYQIISLLGQGGMGRVYLARQINLDTNKLLAIKEMFENNFDTPADRQKAIEQFKVEANILASLTHPSLPKVYDYFEEN